jgi:hypothetical protein
MRHLLKNTAEFSLKIKKNSKLWISKTQIKYASSAKI